MAGIMDEYDPPTPSKTSFCVRLNPEEYESQTSLCTENALLNLIQHLDKYPSAYQNIMVNRKKVAEENSGIISYAKIKFLSFLSGKDSTYVSEEECTKEVGNVTTEMIKVFNYSEESKGRRCSKRLADKSRNEASTPKFKHLRTDLMDMPPKTPPPPPPFKKMKDKDLSRSLPPPLPPSSRRSSRNKRYDGQPPAPSQLTKSLKKNPSPLYDLPPKPSTHSSSSRPPRSLSSSKSTRNDPPLNVPPPPPPPPPLVHTPHLSHSTPANSTLTRRPLSACNIKRKVDSRSTVPFNDVLKQISDPNGKKKLKNRVESSIGGTPVVGWPRNKAEDSNIRFFNTELVDKFKNIRSPPVQDCCEIENSSFELSP